MSRRVVVTGLGMVSPLGNTVESSWRAALEGTSGVGLNEYFDTEDFGVKICAAVKGFEVADYLDVKEARRLDTFIQLKGTGKTFVIAAHSTDFGLDRPFIDKAYYLHAAQ